MSILVEYDVITNRVKSVGQAPDPSEFAGRSDVLYFTDRTPVHEDAIRLLAAANPVKYLKVVNGSVDVMTAQEKAAVDAEIEAERIANLREAASEIIDASTPEGAIQRAILLEQLEDRNTRIADQFNALLTWLGAQTTLTNRAQLSGFAMVKPTIDQVKTAVKNRISGGFVDTSARPQ